MDDYFENSVATSGSLIGMFIGGGLGGGGGAVAGSPTGPGEVVAIAAGAIQGAAWGGALGWAAGKLLGHALNGLSGKMAGLFNQAKAANNQQQAKCPDGGGGPSQSTPRSPKSLKGRVNWTLAIF